MLEHQRLPGRRRQFTASVHRTADCDREERAGCHRARVGGLHSYC